MSVFDFGNPAMQVYAISASLAVLKIMGQGWMTVYRMMKSNSGLASPEDLRPGPLNREPSPEQLDIDDYVDRSRRMHRNDLENIPAFLAIGLLFALTEPSLLLAQNPCRQSR
jgi:glutathione S-transferase